jgi:hypothetical protein
LLLYIDTHFSYTAQLSIIDLTSNLDLGIDSLFYKLKQPNSLTLWENVLLPKNVIARFGRILYFFVSKRSIGLHIVNSMYTIAILNFRQNKAGEFKLVC